MNDLIAVLQFITTADHFATQRIKNAVLRREGALPRYELTAAEARELLPAGSYFEITNTTNAQLNGAVAQVIDVTRGMVLYEADGQRGRIDARCCIPISAIEAAAILDTQRPLAKIGSFGKIRGTKYAGAHAIILKVLKNKFSLVLVDGPDAGAVIKGTQDIFQAEKHTPKPKLLVTFKNEDDRGTFGQVTIYDTTKVDPANFVPIGKEIDGIVRLSTWLSRTEAQILARALGAKFEET